MNLLAIYSYLAGSSGTFRFQLERKVLEDLLAWIKPNLPGSLRDFRFSLNGKDRFRLNAELSNSFVQLLGKPFLNILGADGVEIHLIKRLATRKAFHLEARLETTFIGKQVVDRVVRAFNESLGLEVLRASTEWLSEYVHLTLNPFPLLQRYLPVGLGNDIHQVQLQTTHHAVFLDLAWHHQGIIYAVPSHAKGDTMSPSMQELLGKMIRTQFSDLKGSSAELSLQLPEPFLNELLAMAMNSQQDQIPLLSLIKAARVNGTLTANITLKA